MKYRDIVTGAVIEPTPQAERLIAQNPLNVPIIEGQPAEEPKPKPRRRAPRAKTEKE